MADRRGSYSSRNTGNRSSSQRPLNRSSRSSGHRVNDPASPTGRSSSVSSVRIGDLQGSRSTARRKPAPNVRPGAGKKRTWLRAVIIVVAIALAGVIAWVSVSLSGAFAVQQVTVTGVMHLTASEVADLAAVPVGSTLMRVDAGAIEGRLESNAWIQDAHVNRIFPDTLELAITEREVGAVVELTSTSTQQTEKWAISRDGIWLMFIPEEGSSEAGKVSQQIYIDAENVLHIADVPYGVNPKAGAYCTDDSVLNAMSIINQLSTELADQIVWVSATDRANTVLTLDNGIEIAFGSDDDVRSKERVCLQLMKEHPGKISYINVRVVDRPTWRRLY